ncbi:MarR family winged helix-turn-helix transcriptional regulator [Rugosimonospora africana]|nr:MarR family transcriptional regulator [Rugosimonospora africana]
MEPTRENEPRGDAGRPDPDGEALVDALARSAFVVMGVLNRIGAQYDLSLTQLRVLGILRDRRVRMTDLANFLGLDKSTMSGLVDRAERRGLLERGRNPTDGRAVDVYMTAAGLELAQQAHGEVRRALASATGRLGKQERHRLTQLLEHMLGPADVQEPVGKPS